MVEWNEGNDLRDLGTDWGSAFFPAAELLPHQQDYRLGHLESPLSLFFGVRLKRHGGRSERVRIAGGNIVLIQDSAGSDMAREILVYLGAFFNQPRHRVNEDGAPSLMRNPLRAF
jgi:hypothetical protein